MRVTQTRLPFNELSRRWHDLAQRRLTYYMELYRSGRWKRYYASEEQFALRMLDVIRNAKTWAALAGCEPVSATEGDDLRSAA